MDAYFLQNTGRVLLASILQFSILYLLYVTLKNTLLRKISARADHFILVALVFTGAGLFISGLFNSISQSSNGLFIASGKLPGEQYSFLNPVLQWVAILYLSVTIIRALYLLRQLAFPGYRKYLDPVPLTADFTEYLEAFCAHVRLKLPRIMFSAKVNTPFVTGLFRSMIVIPASFQGCFTPQELEAVILHEMAHLKRLDILLNIPVIICSQLLFFNPFAVLLIRRLRSQRELACDDWVLSQHIKPMHYATALYKTARKQSPAWQLAMSAGKGELYTRIERLFAKNRLHHPYKIRIAPFATLLLCFPLMMQVAPVVPGNTLVVQGYALGRTSPVLLSEQRIPVIGNDLREKPIVAPVVQKKTVLLPALKKNAHNLFLTKTKNGVNVTPAEYIIEVQPVSDAVSVLPKTIFVSDGTKRSEDIVLRFSDSVNLYAAFISKENVETITNTQLEKVMEWVAQGVSDEVVKEGYKLVLKAPEAKVDVSSDGEKNLYFANATVTQQTQYDTYFQQWKIRFSIMNGDQQIGNRYVTIYQKRKLQSARL